MSERSIRRGFGRTGLATAICHAVAIVVLLIIPFLFEPFRVTQITQILVVTIAVMGLNLLTGFTGQISVGHAAFGSADGLVESKTA